MFVEGEKGGRISAIAGGAQPSCLSACDPVAEFWELRKDPLALWSMSEHCVVVLGFLGNRLNYIPMLNNLAIFDPENVDDR